VHSFGDAQINGTINAPNSRETALRKNFAMALGSHTLENQLLLCCARTQLDGAAKTRAQQLIEKDLDWSYLLEAANAHGVGPLLYTSLRAIGQDVLPAATQASLRNHTQQVFVHSSLLTQELLNVLAAFEAQDLPAIPFKGPVLAASAYGNLALRPFGDVDIWVRRKDLTRAKEILVSLGYCPGQPEEVRDETYLRTHHDYLFIKKSKDNKIPLELQWGVTEPLFSFPIEFQSLWERRRAVSLLGRTTPNLSVEDTLLILCVHGAKHGWNKLMWVCDIAEVIRVNSHIDWTWLIEHAEKLGGRRMLLLGLHLANTLLETRLPEKVELQVQADRTIGSLARQVSEELLRGAYEPSGILEERPFLYMKLREHWRDRLQVFLHYCPEYFARMVTPNRLDHAFLPLPNALSSLYYVVRPLRLMSLYARQTLGSSRFCPKL
jgi:hypothetical protein